MASTPLNSGLDRLWGSSLGDDLGFLLARANAASLGGAAAALAPHGLKPRSYAVLALATSDSRPSQRELAAFLLLDPSQVVALVDELQERGLVRREPDPVDRRANLVLATPEGRELFEVARAAAERAEHDAHAQLTVAERTRLAELLRAVAR